MMRDMGCVSFVRMMMVTVIRFVEYLLAGTVGIYLRVLKIIGRPSKWKTGKRL